MNQEKRAVVTSQKPIIFWIMEFGTPNFDLFDECVERLPEYKFIHAASVPNPRAFQADIIENIIRADYIIADVSDKNLNVMLELGIAEAFNKKTITITQEINLPSDITQYRVTPYSFDIKGIKKLCADIDEIISRDLRGEIKFGNLVKDYMPDGFIQVITALIKFYRQEGNLEGFYQRFIENEISELGLAPVVPKNTNTSEYDKFLRAIKSLEFALPAFDILKRAFQEKSLIVVGRFAEESSPEVIRFITGVKISKRLCFESYDLPQLKAALNALCDAELVVLMENDIHQQVYKITEFCACNATQYFAPEPLQSPTPCGELSELARNILRAMAQTNYLIKCVTDRDTRFNCGRYLLPCNSHREIAELDDALEQLETQLLIKKTSKPSTSYFRWEIIAKGYREVEEEGNIPPSFPIK